MSQTIDGRPYSGLLPDERVAQRRRRLLDSACEHFGTTGYAGTRVEQICSTAKVSTKTFYQLYANKEALFLDLYEEISSRSVGAAVDVLAATEGRPMAERIPQAFLAYTRPMVEDVRVARIAFVEIMGVSPEVEARRLAYREALVAIVEAEGAAAVQRREISDRDFRFATLSLAGAANATVFDWVMRSEREGAASFEEKLARLALDLLGG